MSKEIFYADTAMVHCTDNGRTVQGEIMNFIPEKYLSISIARQVKLNLKYDPSTKVYVSNSGGLEFQSDGPAEVGQW